MFDGYLAYGPPGAQVEIINNPLTVAISQAWGFNVRNCGGCPPVLLPTSPSGDPDIAMAPWYDPVTPASGEFAGFIGQQVGGVGKFPGVRNPLRVNSAGAQLGRIQQSYREVVVNCYAVASSQRGLSYGLAWLSGQLRGTCLASAGCGASQAMTLWADCNLADTSGRRQLYNVGLLQGPEQTSKANPRFNSPDCNGRAFWGADVVFTVAAGWPWMYSDPVPIAPALPFVVPLYWPCNATWVPEGTGGTTPPDCTDSPLEHCVQWVPSTDAACDTSCPGSLDGDCMTDPDCTPVTPAPTPPVSANPCVCLATVQPLVATASVAQGLLPAFSELVPIIQVTTGGQDMRRLVISFYANVPGGICNYNELSACSLAGQIGIPRVPANSVLTLDGRTQTALVACPDGTSAQPVLYSGVGPAVSWPVLSCGSAWCVSATVDENFVDAANASMGISLVARQDAG